MISVFGSSVGEEEILNVSNCLKSQWLGLGKQVNEFEKKFEKKFSLKNFLMVDSGSNALFMAIKLLDLPKNSHIIVPSFTWVSCAQAVVMAGHIPIFCDVDLETMNVTKTNIEEVITSKTSAIMIIHYAGLPVEFDEIKSFNLPIIEDAAHAVDSTYKGMPCGSLGDASIFSFDAVKNLTVGEGGGVVVKDKNIFERAKKLRYCGIGKSGFEESSSANKALWWEYDISESFIKMLPNNISASIGLAQLEKIDKLQKLRKNLWKIYQEEFKDFEHIITPKDSIRNDKHSYFTYCIRCANRNKLAQYLLANEVYTTLRYHPLHFSKIYKQDHIVLENCNLLNETALSLPLHPRLSISEQEKVINLVKSFYK